MDQVYLWRFYGVWSDGKPQLEVATENEMALHAQIHNLKGPFYRCPMEEWKPTSQPVTSSASSPALSPPLSASSSPSPERIES